MVPPVVPLLMDVENLCRWLEQPNDSARGVALSARRMKISPAWVPSHAPLPHVNHLLELLIQGERQLNDELRTTQERGEITSVQKRQAILTLTRSIRRARKQSNRARLIVSHMKRDMGNDLQNPLDLYLRMFSLQAQQFKALSQSADSAVLALPHHAYRSSLSPLGMSPSVSVQIMKPLGFVVPSPLRQNPIAFVRRWTLSFWSGSRVFRDWLMHPVIDSREPSEPAG